MSINDQGNEDGKIKLTGIRGMIADKMSLSLLNSAQYTLSMRADITELLKQREVLKEKIKLSVTDILIKATALTLQEYPVMNAWVDKEEIFLQKQINIGIAIATHDGLIVAVLKNAEGKTLSQIADEAKSLAQKARTKTLKLSEFTGGTFTISNLGMYGIEHFTPIINSPEVAILGVGAVVETAVREEGGGIVWHMMLPLSLTIDHRAVDGAPAAEFLQALCFRLSEMVVGNYIEQA